MAAPTTPIKLPDTADASPDNFDVIGTKKGFLVAWTEGDFDHSVEVQRFKANGDPIGKPVTLEPPSAFIGADPNLVALGGDKFGVVWSGSDTLESTVFNAATGKAGKPVALNDLPAGVGHELTHLANGHVALLSSFQKFGDETTTLTILDASMKPLGAPRTVSVAADPFEQNGSEHATVLADGSGGIAYYRTETGAIDAVSFDASGKLGKAFQVNTTKVGDINFDRRDFTVEAEHLASGGHVVVWQSGDDVRARVYDSHGKAAGKDFLVEQDVGGQHANPEILTFDKGFAIAWHATPEEDAFSREATQVMRFFDDHGVAISDEITTEYFGAAGASGIEEPAQAAEYTKLADGSYVKVFNDSANGFTGEGVYYVDGIPKPSFGSAKADKITGKSGDDIVLGAAGKDKLKGADGADTLDGGGDKDKLDGGAGDDQLIGGAGNDVLKGGGGQDVFMFRPGGGTDKVSDFSAAGDRLDVTAFHYDQFQDVLDHAVQKGADVLIKLVDQNDPRGAGAVLLQHVTLSDLAPDDFIV
ncbi:MAG: calcium-binding protein [Hansschlegelia sp.]